MNGEDLVVYRNELCLASIKKVGIHFFKEHKIIAAIVYDRYVLYNTIILYMDAVVFF